MNASLDADLRESTSVLSVEPHAAAGRGLVAKRDCTRGKQCQCAAMGCMCGSISVVPGRHGSEPCLRMMLPGSGGHTVDRA